MVVDENGEPVQGARVRPSLQFKNSRMYTGREVKTDRTGRWQFHTIPAHMKSVPMRVNHPEFRPLSTKVSVRKYQLSAEAKPTQPLRLDRGLSIAGRVTGPNNEPVKGALVRAKFSSGTRSTTTDASGRYSLSGCDKRQTRLVVSAKGMAIDARKVRVAAEMEPVNFQMETGGHVRVRVLDEQGNGIPNTRIFFQKWRGEHAYFEFDHVKDRTNQDGIWEWNEAPNDAFTADVCRPGGMQLSDQELEARQEEYIFRPRSPMVISGKVVDAKTGTPIEKFRVTPGVRSRDGGLINWITREAFDGAKGEYSLKRTYDYSAHVIKIESDGYLTAVSRDVRSDEPNPVVVSFPLKVGTPATGRIITPGNKPASGAEIVLADKGDQVSIDNGRFDFSSTYGALRSQSDKVGRFRFPPQGNDYHLIVLHETGYAIQSPEPDESVGIIKLTPWARVTGVFRIGKDVKPDVPLTMQLSCQQLSQHRHYAQYETTTGPDGRYSFDRVFVGDGSIGRRLLIMVDEGAVDIGSSRRQYLATQAGAATTRNLGGDGRSVSGRLLPVSGTDPTAMVWSHGMLYVDPIVPDKPEPPYPEGIKGNAQAQFDWMRGWRSTEEGEAWRKQYDAWRLKQRQADRFWVSIGKDGTFRLDDVPPGEYSLRLDLIGGNLIGSIKQTFRVEPATDSKPLDLGELQLK